MNPDIGEDMLCYEWGTTFYVKKQMFNAIKSYLKAIQYNPEWNERFCSRGLVFQNLHLGNEEIQSFISMFDLEDEKQVADYLRSFVLLLQERFKEAIEIINLIDIGTINTLFFHHLQLNLGIAYQGLNNYDEAQRNYDLAILGLSKKKIYLPYYHRGNLYIQLGLNDHAMDDLNQCIELNPNFASAYIEKGLLLKDKEKAKLNLEIAIKLSPNNPYYLTCLGIFYNNNFNEDEAILNLRKANTLWSEKGLPYLKKNFVLTQKEIAFIQSNLQKFERLIRNERRRSQSQQSLQDVVYAQQKEIVELQNEVKYLKVEQKKIKKSLTPMQKDIDNLKKVQIIHRDILEKKILIKQNWERLKAQGNECERIYCECLFWKLSSYIHACIQANTQFFQINPQEINPSSNSFSQFFVEASIALLKIIGFVPSIGAIAGLIGEAIQEISEKHKKSTFKEKLQKIALVAQKSAADDLDEQIQLATFQMGNQLIERQFKQWKTKKQKYYKYVEKIAQLEKNNGKLEASRLEYMQALEDSLYILSHIVEESKAFLENDKCFSEIIVYIFKTHIYKS